MSMEGSATSIKNYTKRLSGVGRSLASELKDSLSLPLRSSLKSDAVDRSQPHDVQMTPSLEDEPWMEAYRQNLSSSMAYNLPEEILLRIMEQLPPETMYFFRQSCLLFRRLSHDREFRHLKVSDDAFQPGKSYPYPAFTNDAGERGHPIFGVVQTYDIRNRIRQHSFCEDCRQAMQDFPRLGRSSLSFRAHTLRACGGCRTGHQDILFSEKQRRTDVTKRLCIGREGYVRICKHLTVSWDDVEKVLKTGGERRFCCRDRSHTQRVPTHQRREIEAVYGRQKLGRLYPSLHIQCISSARRREKAVRIQIEWLAVPFNTLKADQPVTRGILRANLAAGDLQHVTTLCPHEAFDEFRFLGAFDPTHCSCVRGDNPTDHSTSKCQRKACCLCFSVLNGGRNGGKLLATEASPSKSLSSGPEVEHRSSCSYCATRYKWGRAGDVITLSRNSTFIVATPTDPAWVRLLDLQSYNLEDEESKNVYWCDIPECATSRQWKTRLALTRLLWPGLAPS